MKESPKWFVYRLDPRDFFEEATLYVSDWIDKEITIPPHVAKTDKWSEFLSAVSTVTRHRLWEWDFTTEPCVGYDVNSDSYYFIFKMLNNGSTFVVSKDKVVTDKNIILDVMP
ncbi:MAG: hypothetical protein HYV59_09655 [Planctomycetes bacterium]|nr:hypothetical protein [Planctomycetota bacterium]